MWGGLNASISGDGFFLVKSLKGGSAPDNIKDNAYYFTRVGQFTLDSNGYLVDGDKNFVFGFAPSNEDNGELEMDNLVPIRMPDKGSYVPSKPNNTDPDKMDPAKAEFSYEDGPTILAQEVTINSAGEIMAKIEYEYSEDATGNIIVPPAANQTVKKGTAVLSLGKVAVATFQNPNGLTKAGGNYYTTSKGDNAGDAQATIAGGAAPDLMPGYVEASNVDLAKEFSDMITTHRGFQSNTKMITVSDEMLSDLVSMKR